jgi:hypothetical protein
MVGRHARQGPQVKGEGSCVTDGLLAPLTVNAAGECRPEVSAADRASFDLWVAP